MIIRWSRVLPRLVIFVLLLVAAWFGRNALIKWQLCRQIESQTGTAAQIESVQSELLDGRVQMIGLRLSDPKGEKRELLTTEKIVAQMDRNALLLRQFLLSSVEIEGLRMSVEGVEGDDWVPDKLWSRFKDRIPQEIEPLSGFDWTAFLTEKPEDAAKGLLKQLETSRTVTEIKNRWPEDVRQFEAGSEAIKRRFQNVKTLTDGVQRGGDTLQQVNGILGELEGTDREIQALLNSIAALNTKARADWEQISKAAQQDQATLEALPVQGIDKEELSKTLVGPELREQWDKALAWGDWARSLLVPVQLDDSFAPIYERFDLKPPPKTPGETIHISSLDARPELLIEKTSVTGQILFGDTPLFFNGVIENIAYPMTMGPAPTVAHFCFSGSGIPSSPYMPTGEQILREQEAALVNPDLPPNLYVMLQVDRIGENEEDLIKFCCPIYRLPERTLGKEGKFEVLVSPGVTRLDGSLLLRGDRLSGQIRLEQGGIRMAARLPENARHADLQRVLQQTLDSVSGFTAEIHIGGTRQQPTYHVQSDLADRLQPQLENLLRGEWDSVRLQARQLLQNEANQGYAELNDIVKNKLEPTWKEIDGQRNDWEKKLAQAGNVPIDQLIQSQRDKLSEKDRQRLDRFLAAPAVQGILQNADGAAPGNIGGVTLPGDLDQKIQREADRLQDKIPGLLDRLNKR